MPFTFAVETVVVQAPTDYLSLLLTGAIGVSSAIVGVLVGARLQEWVEERTRVDRLRFQIYMKGMALSPVLERLRRMDSRGDPIDERERKEALAIGWDIADLLRQADTLVDESLLRVIFDDRQSWAQRHDLLEKVLRRIGTRVNPRYVEIVQRIDREQIEAGIPHAMQMIDRIKRPPEGSR